MIELMSKYLSYASGVYECTDMKINALIGAASRQLEINHNEAALKVMTESGTDDDLHYLYEEADKSFIETTRKAVQKIKDNIIQFFSELRDKIIFLMTEKDIKRTLEQMQKRIKFMPLVGRIKITIENFAEQMKAGAAAVSRLNKIIAKKASGQSVTIDDVAKVDNFFTTEHEKAIGVKMAVVTTVGSAIDMLVEKMKTLSSDIKKIEEDAKADLNKVYRELEKSESTEGASVWTKICSTCSRIAQKMGEDHLRFFKDTLSKIKATISRNKNIDDDERTVDKSSSVSESSTPVNCSDNDDPIDSVDVDSWDSVMNNLDDVTTSNYFSDDNFSGDSTNESTDTFDTLFQEFFGESEESNECDDDILSCYSRTKPSSEKIVSDIYRDIMDCVKYKYPKDTVTNESSTTFDSLMDEIQSMF